MKMCGCVLGNNFFVCFATQLYLGLVTPLVGCGDPLYMSLLVWFLYAVYGNIDLLFFYDFDPINYKYSFKYHVKLNNIFA